MVSLMKIVSIIISTSHQWLLYSNPLTSKREYIVVTLTLLFLKLLHMVISTKVLVLKPSNCNPVTTRESFKL